MSDGIGCECAAHYEGECCCDADWTPQETIDLRAEVAELKVTLEAERVGSSMQFDHINALKANLEVARACLEKVNAAFDDLSDHIQDEFENGVQSLSAHAAHTFKERYPSIHQGLESLLDASVATDEALAAIK